MQKWNRWHDWANVVPGVIPVDLANPDNRAGERLEGVLGVLVFISPFVLGFSGTTMMAWSAGIIGVLSILLAASVLFDDRGHKTLTAH